MTLEAVERRADNVLWLRYRVSAASKVIARGWLDVGADMAVASVGRMPCRASSSGR